ncbi:hypothetical protein NQ318_012378 [Aromia moschata]|uniref:Uncharacterized protein n=1 Tax=Aromia moschata TaxID=1265417 RepID=A0AAV8Y548_9CUCU|nr:hypothetical protein NQ318_012378 [Aromia moschata]
MILCAQLAIMGVALAISRQVRINQPNTIEGTGQENLVDADRDAAPNASYEFAYDVNDPLSNDVKSHREIRDGENVYGYYTFKEADGSTRVVNYKVGPQTGFEATVERLELGERPEIKGPSHSPAPQLVQANVQVEQRRRPQVRARVQQPRQQPQAVQPVRQSQQFVEQPQVNVVVAQPDEKPLKQSAVDKIIRRPNRLGGEAPTPNTQLEQDWKNSVVGRKHIRQQIAQLAKTKEEEEALKAAKTTEQEQETTLPPTEPSVETSSASASSEESTEAPEEGDGKREDDDDDEYERNRRGEDDDDDFGSHNDHEREEEEEDEE